MKSKAYVKGDSRVRCIKRDYNIFLACVKFSVTPVKAILLAIVVHFTVRVYRQTRVNDRSSISLQSNGD